MRQIVQDYKTGTLRIAEVPAPAALAGGVLVRSAFSLVSTGTERMKVEQARMSLLQKARSRPDKVEQVLESIRQNGWRETYHKVQERLSALTSLGYSLSGVVEEVGDGVDEFQVGGRVACAGEGFANHAEYCYVPKNLCVHVPEDVRLEDAAFATVGAIAINGVRQAQVTLGDSVLVIGLGLVGLLAVQVLRAAGCRVIGTDIDPARLQVARECGACAAFASSDPSLSDAVQQMTGGRGVDAAYIAASANSSEPMRLGGELTRDRGVIAVVGMIKIEADWRTYYNKELRVVMSRSYGPGRYDSMFEQKGIDYPAGYVRWTERRNLEEFLSLVQQGKISTAPLAPETVDFEQAAEVYAGLNGRSRTVLFRYPDNPQADRRVPLEPAAGNHRQNGRSAVRLGIIGAGNFTTGMIIPSLRAVPEARLRAICSARGLSAKGTAERYGFEYCASDYRELLEDDEIDAVVVATRHNTHAAFATEALEAGKHVFVEKPLALTHDELKRVIAAAQSCDRIIMPGFNRRFSELSIAVRDFFAGRSSPIEVVCRVNAGPLDANSWYRDPDVGGWRLISEGCHFVDLIQFICGAHPVRARTETIDGPLPGAQRDNNTTILKMADGSLGTIIYVSNGDTTLGKERVEVFGQGRAAIIDNFHRADLRSGCRSKSISAGASRKGHCAELAAFVHAVAEGGPSPIPLADAVAATMTTFMMAASVGSLDPCSVETDLKTCA